MLLRELRAGGYEPCCERVETVAMMSAALDRQSRDVVFVDPYMPTVSAHGALTLSGQKDIDVPLIAILDGGNAVAATDLLKLGAHDYIVRTRAKRLVPAVERRLREARNRRERAQLTQDLQEARERLRVLSAGMMDVQEAERRRIALDLHDEVGQALTSIKIHLDTIRRLPAAAPVARQLEETLPIVDLAIEQVRDLCLNLRPPQLDDLGLVPALRWLLARQARSAGWRAHFHTELASVRWDPQWETACFRIAQEFLTNTARHAAARQVWIYLNQSDGVLKLSLSDDGRGFDVTAARERALEGASLGLIAVEERVALAGGQLSWDTSPGRGSKLHVVLPLVSKSQFRRTWGKRRMHRAK